MAQMLRVDSAVSLIEKHYAAILCTLLMRVGTASGVDKGNSSIDACGAVRAFLECASEDVLLKKLDQAQVWPVLEKSSYDDGMTTVTRAFSEVHPDRKRAVLQYLARFFSQQSYTGQRIVATAMLAEFVNHSSDDVTLLREVIKFLLPRVADKVNKVRKQALRGLGHLVTVWNAETSAMATSVLSSLTAAAEDADADVAAEAVLSLTRIAGVVSEELVGPMLISICFRLRPAFDRKEDLVRARSFTLFGALCRFGTAEDAGLRGNFIDQVHASVPIFFVHSNDASEAVRTATVEAFRFMAPLLGESCVPILADATGEPHNYDELVLRLAPMLNSLHPDRLRNYLENTTQYFTAASTAIRGNAAFLAGVVISTATPEQRKTVSIAALTAGQHQHAEHTQHKNARIRSLQHLPVSSFSVKSRLFSRIGRCPSGRNSDAKDSPLSSLSLCAASLSALFLQLCPLPFSCCLCVAACSCARSVARAAASAGRSSGRRSQPRSQGAQLVPPDLRTLRHNSPLLPSALSLSPSAFPVPRSGSMAPRSLTFWSRDAWPERTRFPRSSLSSPPVRASLHTRSLLLSSFVL